MLNPDDIKVVGDRLLDRNWRMNNLYHIIDTTGQVVPFRMNESQAEFWGGMWWLSVILKDRQRGFSTLIALFILDSCLFEPNTQAGIIDITLPDAQKKLAKIKFAYDHLPKSIQQRIPLTTDAKTTLAWSNGSRVDISTSHRGGTLNILHISELGKIAARKPDVAREIRTGAYNTVDKENYIFIESTAEGQEGEFYDVCQDARNAQLEGRHLTVLDNKFFFFGWWMGFKNEMDPEGVVVNATTAKYLDIVESKIGRVLGPRKRAWYQKKLNQQRDDMTREYPSTPEEAFQASVDGSYFSQEMARARKEGRITSVPYNSAYPVDTFWDLGFDDSMTIWFRQRIGSQNRIIDYESHNGEGFPYYAKLLHEKGYLYGKHHMPHDIANHELGTGLSRLTAAEDLGIKPIEPVKRPRDIEAVLAGIEEIRSFLSTCVFDAERCDAGAKDESGIKCLDNYKKEWDERLGTFRRSPLHNWASHGADAFRTGAVGLKDETDLIYRPPDGIAMSEKDWRSITGANEHSVAFNMEDD